MTSHIKRLILDRQKAYHYGKGARWRELRNKASEEINNRKKSFYAEKVKNLKNTDPRKWWNLVNRLSGKSSNILTLTCEADGKILSGTDLAERLNRFFISVTADIPVLDRGTLPAFLPAAESLPTEYEHVRYIKSC